MLSNWGVNDAEYNVYVTTKVEGKTVIVWQCPIYRDWYSMINRAYGDTKGNKSYVNVTVCEEWKYFSNFRKWVLEEQPNKNWESCCLDKDLLVKGNKIYSPNTCAYISVGVNSFLTDRKADRGKYLLGVTFHKHRKCFVAQCANPFGITAYEKRGYIGGFDTEIDAHLAWKAKKHEYACMLADLETDPRVINALKEYYL